MKIKFAYFLSCFFLLSYYINRAAVSTPFLDEYHFSQLFDSALKGYLSFSEFWAPHSGHIYFIPKIIYWITIYFKLPLISMMYLNALMMSASALYITQKFKPLIDIDYGKIQKFIILLSLTLILVGLQNWENIYWALQVSISISTFFILVSLFNLNEYLKNNTSTNLIACIFSACIVSLCTGSGVFFLALILLFLSIKRPQVMRSFYWLNGAFVFIVVFATLTSYALEKISTTNANPNFLEQMPGYVSIYIGAGLLPTNIPQFLLVTAGSLLILTLVLVFYKNRTELNPSTTILVAYAFVIMTLGIYSRLKIGIYQPDAPRYYIYSAFFLIGLIIQASVLKNQFHKFLLMALCPLIILGSIRATIIEHFTAPYRKLNLTEAHQNLCSHSHATMVEITTTQREILQNAFCHYSKIKKISAAELLRNAARAEGISGLEIELDKIWISPSLIFHSDADLSNGILVKGYIPDTSAYTDNTLIISAYINGTYSGGVKIRSSGGFEKIIKPDKNLVSVPYRIELLSSKRNSDHTKDKRSLSWVLDLIEIKE